MASIRENVPLAGYTVYNIGGPARYFTEANNLEEIREAVSFARDSRVPIFVLGGGSNILVSDAGFPGLVLLVRAASLEVSNDTIRAEAGVKMARVTSAALTAGLVGFEWGVGIPGTVGGSIRGNAGCFGGEIKDVLEAVDVLNAEDPAFPVFTIGASECAFGYRDSIFKTHPAWIILSARIRLRRGTDEDVRRARTLVVEIGRIRIAEQDIGTPSAGSTFKGVPVTNELLSFLAARDSLWQKRHPASSWVFENRRGMMSAGFLIEMAGLKGAREGGARVSERHANFIVHDGLAKAADVRTLIRRVKDTVKERFGIELEEEIEYVGFSE